MDQRNPFEPPHSRVADVQPSIDGNAAMLRRPKAIDLAFWLIIASAALSPLSFALGGMRESLFVEGFGLLMVVGIAAQVRSGKNWARILFAVFFAIGLTTYFSVLELVAQRGFPFVAIFALQTVLQGSALWLAFRAPGSGWFKKARAS